MSEEMFRTIIANVGGMDNAELERKALDIAASCFGDDFDFEVVPNYSVRDWGGGGIRDYGYRYKSEVHVRAIPREESVRETPQIKTTPWGSTARELERKALDAALAFFGEGYEFELDRNYRVQDWEGLVKPQGRFCAQITIRAFSLPAKENLPDPGFQEEDPEGPDGSGCG